MTLWTKTIWKLNSCCSFLQGKLSQTCFMFQRWSCAPPEWFFLKHSPKLCSDAFWKNSLHEFRVLGRKKRRICVGPLSLLLLSCILNSSRWIVHTNYSFSFTPSALLPSKCFSPALKIIDPAIYQRVETGDLEGHTCTMAGFSNAASCLNFPSQP